MTMNSPRAGRIRATAAHRREQFTHWRTHRVERRRFIRASTPPGCVKTRTFGYFMLAQFVILILVAVGFILLYSRTAAVCEPLRFGERAGQQTTSKAGQDFARTFGSAADRLGCKGR